MRRVTDERGGVLPLFLLSLPVVIVVLALSVDVGNLLRLRAVAEGAADLAALAGVQELDLTRLAAGERALMPARAREQARRTALAGLTANLPPGFTSVRIDVAVINASPPDPGRHPWTGRPLYDPTVAVQVRLRIPLYFAGPARLAVWTTAEADASVLPRIRDDDPPVIGR